MNRVKRTSRLWEEVRPVVTKGQEHRRHMRNMRRTARTMNAQARELKRQELMMLSQRNLRVKAKELGIPGRSKMNKEQLVEALL